MDNDRLVWDYPFRIHRKDGDIVKRGYRGISLDARFWTGLDCSLRRRRENEQGGDPGKLLEPGALEADQWAPVEIIAEFVRVLPLMDSTPGIISAGIPAGEARLATEKFVLGRPCQINSR
jgi:hypothetical protein